VKLVPSCGVLWGSAPKVFTSIPVTTGLADDENLADRPLDILHQYHVNDQLFPTATEKSLALQPGSNRLLLENWKPATDMSWAAVAAGQDDARIDRLASYIDTNFPYKFFLSIWHEPENDVVATAGSGKTAADYAAMFRHVVLRLRADGVTNAVIVMNYMGFDNWASQSWFNQLWPGDDVVDWIGLDPYMSGAASGYMAGDLAKMVNRPNGSFPGYYSWATTNHPGKPIMLSEWGVVQDPSNPDGQAKFFQSIPQEIGNFPWLKAMVYFDMPVATAASGGVVGVTSPDQNSTSLAAWRATGRALAGPAIKY
jgi:hypothetical protein